MSSSDEDLDNRLEMNLNQLPDELLSYIFSFLRPYQDLNSCRTVCHRWARIIKDLRHLIQYNFFRCLKSCDISWVTYQSVSNVHDITNRYGHSAIYYDNFIYIFGGFTSFSTSFNDLWKLNLHTQTWQRIRASGEYPSPKACASFVRYKDSLILYGGMATTFRIFQDRTALNGDLHIYNITENKWQLYGVGEYAPPNLAAHTASVHGDTMVIFGGLSHESSVKKLWLLDLTNMIWKKNPATNLGPEARYGHTQIAIDNTHLLIIGGCTTQPFRVFQDIWLLSMEGDTWNWQEIDIGANGSFLSTVWCHAACKVGNFIVGFTNNKNLMSPTNYLSWIPDSEESFSDVRGISVDAMCLEVPRIHYDRDNRRKLDYINILVDELFFPERNQNFIHLPNESGSNLNCHKKVLSTSPRRVYPFRQYKSYNVPLLEMYVIDISDILSNGFPITWHHGISPWDTPNDTIMYSLVAGCGELIMFGGVQRRSSKGQSSSSEGIESKVVNYLHFISSKNQVN